MSIDSGGTEAPADARSWTSTARDFSELGAGSLVNGVAAFGIATAATHAYGSAGASGFVNLWTIWLAATAVLTFPLQHWIVLTAAQPVPRRTFAALMLGPGVVAFTATTVTRTTLFDSSSLIYPVLAGAIVAGAAPMGMFRGGLMAAGRSRHTALILAAENVLRLVAALLVVAFDGSAAVFSSTILVGYAVVATAPHIWRELLPKAADASIGVLAIFRPVGIVGSSMLISQLVMASGPLVLAASGAASELVTGTFATLEVCGAVYLLTVGTSLRFTAMLTDRRTIPFLHRVGSVVTLGGTTAAGIGGAAAALVGPQVIGLLFGADAKLSRSSTACIAAGCVLAATALLLLLVCVACDRSTHAFVVWIGSAVLGASTFAVLALDEPLRFALAFLVTECIAVVGLYAIVILRHDDALRGAPQRT